MRIEQDYDLRLGDVLICPKGLKWVHVGATEVEGGKAYVFVRDVDGLMGTTSIKDRMWVKHIAMSAGLERAFTNTESYRRVQS